jgi:putative flippase GtrA
MIGRQTRIELLRFAVSGVAGLAVDVLVLYLALALGAGFHAGRLLSFLAAVWVTWQLNRRYTFTGAGLSPWRQWWRYLGAMAVGGAVNYAVSAAVMALLAHSRRAAPLLPAAPLLAVCCGTLAGLTLNFISAKFLVFHNGHGDVSPLAALCRRFWRWLDSAAMLRRLWLLPLLFGLMSLLLGQDDNWDWRNYHLYNPFALMNGKIGLDLAPAQWQSYFNPTLDLVHYGLALLLPAPLAGFAMGALQGLNVLLLFAIGRRSLTHLPHPAPLRTPLLLALAGCMGCAFFSELGNSMGDNLTALFVLGAVLLVLRGWPVLAAPGAGGRNALALAGLLAGACTGLKLTNATYALALCLALLLSPGVWWRRLLHAFLCGLGVLAGIALTAGHWFWRMWHEFGNPLFPQFNNIFHAPLAAPIGIGDTHWLPQGWAETLLWPFIFALHPQRVMEITAVLLLWPLLYLGFAWLAVALLRARPAATPAVPEPVRFMLVFFVLAYAGWQALFSIYRYLVPLELLAPLVLWLIAHRLAPAGGAGRAAGAFIAAAVLLALPTPHWGRAGWSGEAFRVQTPAMPRPEQALVFSTQAPMGWYAAGFPATLAFVSVGAGFPESAGYAARVQAMLAARSGPWYVLLASRQADPKYPAPGAAASAAAAVREHDELADAAAILGRYGLTPDGGRCAAYAAYIGRNYLPYRLCPVGRLPG